MWKFLPALFLILLLIIFPNKIHAQIPLFDELSQESTKSAIASESAGKQQEEIKQDVTKPEEKEQKEEILRLFQKRPAEKLTLFNFTAFAIQQIVKTGVPANTVVLILLLPVLATIIVFFRYVIGLPSLGLLVPIALSITLLATGITTGLILLSTIIFASLFSRLLLKKIHIMQLPKIALSVFVVSVLILFILALSAIGGLIAVKQLSIFPVLIMIILSERIVAVQLERSFDETITITGVTLLLSIVGFMLLSFDVLRNLVLLYPEVVLLVIPANIIIGRYFGLRLNEYFRFSSIRN